MLRIRDTMLNNTRRKLFHHKYLSFGQIKSFFEKNVTVIYQLDYFPIIFNKLFMYDTPTKNKKQNSVWAFGR